MSAIHPEAAAAAMSLLPPFDPDHVCKSPTPEEEEESEEEYEPINMIKGNLFDAPNGSVLIHACNTQGKWGAGIALEFKKRYPKAFSTYARACVPRPPIPWVTKGLSVPIQGPVQHSDGQWVNGTFNKFPWPIEGHCLLIPPQEGDYGRPVPRMQKKKRTTGGNRSQNLSSKGRKRVKKHWIACLFTSEGYGSTKSNQIDILHNTRSSMEELLGEINELTEDAKFCKERGESNDYGDEEEGDGEDDEGEEEEEEEEGEGEDDEEVEYDAPGELWACKFNSGKFGVDWEKTEKVVRDVLEKSGQELTLTVVERDGDEVTSGESDMDA